MSTMFHTITPDGTCTPSASPAASPMLRGGGGGGGGGDARAGSSHPFDGASSSDLRALAVGGSPSADPSTQPTNAAHTTITGSPHHYYRHLSTRKRRVSASPTACLPWGVQSCPYSEAAIFPRGAYC